jgi:hypothetical protein
LKKALITFIMVFMKLPAGATLCYTVGGHTIKGLIIN